jgi:dipeptidyl aminopeptidase/acylaminoacyl peptidase
MVNLQFVRDWNDYLACGLNYIVVIVDGRGTGFRGRKLRNPVKGNLGFWETIDQLATARLVVLLSAFFFFAPARIIVLVSRNFRSRPGWSNDQYGGQNT